MTSHQCFNAKQIVNTGFWENKFYATIQCKQAANPEFLKDSWFKRKCTQNSEKISGTGAGVLKIE